MENLKTVNYEASCSDYKLFSVIKELIKDSFAFKKELMNDVAFLEAMESYYRSHAQKNTFIYFIKNNKTGLVKIGYTKDIKERLKQINTSLKSIGKECELKVLAIIPVVSYFAKEAEFHAHLDFNRYRKYGEWFDITESDVLEYHDIAINENYWSDFNYRDYAKYKFNSLGVNPMMTMLGINQITYEGLLNKVFELYDKAIEIKQWAIDTKLTVLINGEAILKWA